MAQKHFDARIQWKRDTSSNWTTNNPVLLNGEIIIVDTDNGEIRFKIGDGTKTYTQLPFEDEVIRNLINAKADKSTLDELVIGAIRHDIAQELTEDQKNQARVNIGAEDEVYILQDGETDANAPDTAVILIDSTESEFDGELSGGVYVEIANNLTTSDPSMVLSAAQGVVLKEMADNLDVTKLETPTTATVGQFIKVSAVDESGNITATETATVDVENADWNQNDETAVDYIKNRPFYIETAEAEETDFIPETQVTFTSGTSSSLYNYAVSDIGNMVEGETYYLTIDGETTSGVATYVGTPFDCYYFQFENGMTWNYSIIEGATNISDGTHTVRLYTATEQSEIVHQIDEKYIPDTIARNMVAVRADIDQSFTEEQQMQARFNQGLYNKSSVILFSGTLTFTDNIATYYNLFETDEVDDGDEIMLSGVLGNGEFTGTIVKKQIGPTDYDITATLNEGSQTFYLTNTSLRYSGSQEVSGDKDVTIIRTKVEKIPEEYIPSSIARQSDIPMIPQSDWNQNDYSANDFIQGRTHYKSGENNYLVEPTTLNIVYGYPELETPITIDTTDFTEGKMVYVIWNGTVYTQIVKSHSMASYYYVGESGDDGTGEPFYIRDIDGTGELTISTVPDNYNTTIDFALATSLVEIKKLDIEYLPIDDEISETGEGLLLNSTIAKVLNTNASKIDEKFEEVNKTKDSLNLKDQENGFDYTIFMSNGTLVSSLRPFTFTVTSTPTTTTYTAGEYFDATGMEVAAVYDDKSSKEITDYQFPADYLTADMTEVTISADILGTQYTTTTAVTVNALNPTAYLADYVYTDNGDGTYTVTGWADTTKMDELTVPNNYFVKIGG